MTYDAGELEGLPEELRDDVQRFLTAVASVTLNTDGVPCDRRQALEINSMASAAHRLVAVLRSPVGTPLGSVRMLADEFGCLLAAFPRHRGSAATRSVMGRRWLAARAAAAELLGPTPGPVPVDPSGVESAPRVTFDEFGRPWTTPDPDDEELPFDHPHVQAMIAANPDLEPLLREAYDD